MNATLDLGAYNRAKRIILDSCNIDVLLREVLARATRLADQVGCLTFSYHDPMTTASQSMQGVMDKIMNSALDASQSEHDAHAYLQRVLADHGNNWNSPSACLTLGLFP
jgi:hypothetical protein